MKKCLLLRDVAIFFAGVMLAESASAYQLWRCEYPQDTYFDWSCFCYRTIYKRSPEKWTSGQTTLWLDRKGLGKGTVWNSKALHAAWAWNQSPSGFTFRVGETDRVSIGDARNQVWFTTSSKYFSPGAVGTTISRINSRCERVEADVLFDAGSTDWTNEEPFQTASGTVAPLVAVALHEYGHVLGLKHESAFASVMGMNDFYNARNGNIPRWNITGDGAKGISALYGVKKRGENISMTDSVYSGINGEYAVLSPGRISEDYIPNHRRPEYKVFPGKTYLGEFTVDNTGFSKQKVRFSLYLSANNLISKSDVLLGQWTGTISPLTQGVSQEFTFRVPSSLKKGVRYFLGMVADPDNAIKETDEQDNVALFVLRTK